MAERRQAVLLDSNLLVLMAVGLFDIKLVGRKRLDVFTVEDFTALSLLVSGYARWLTTPHVLAEVSNLADQCVPKRRHHEFRVFLGGFIEQFHEVFSAAAVLTQTLPFLRLGLADAAVIRSADERTTVLTVDAELRAALIAEGVEAENFYNLRS